MYVLVAKIAGSAGDALSNKLMLFFFFFSPTSSIK
jgi:hypothetical protein